MLQTLLLIHFLFSNCVDKKKWYFKMQWLYRDKTECIVSWVRESCELSPGWGRRESSGQLYLGLLGEIHLEGQQIRPA